MVEYITREALRKGAGPLAEQASVIRKAASRSPQGATFLSHSSKDADLLPGVITLLEKHGAVVYVDKKDDSLPPKTSRDTAAILRQRIAQSKKFLLLTTEQSKDSRWMPWELGLADGNKSQGRVAIFPGVDTAADKEWVKREYLGIYDRVVYGRLQNYANPVYMVWNQDTDTATELSRWLAQ